MLTTEQQKEFTPFNALAFDMARVKAQKSDTRIPPWLASNEATKQRMREEFATEFNQMAYRVVPLSLEQVEEYCNSAAMRITLDPIVLKWKNLENQMQEARQNNDLSAFFI